MKARRFFYVSAPNGSVRHIQYGTLTEGERLSCGLMQRPGWKWATPVSGARKLPVCRACLKKAKSEKVRVSR